VTADPTADGKGTAESAASAAPRRPREEAEVGVSANGRGNVRGRGGVSDWLIGVPAVLLLMRRRRSDRGG
jgi:hypothetical protein